MSGPTLGWLGGIVAAAILAILAGVFFGLDGTTGVLTAALLPAAVAVAAVLASAARRRTELANLARIVTELGAGRSPTGLDAPGLDVLSEPLAKLAENMRTTCGFLTGITQGLPIPFLLVDTKERTLYTNEATMRMLEIDTLPASQLGRTLAEIFYNEPGRQTVVGKAMREGTVSPTKR
jgi:methyl-accepting chemotaxis protein